MRPVSKTSVYQSQGHWNILRVTQLVHIGSQSSKRKEILVHFSDLVVPTVLHLNEKNEKIVVTRPSPPVPQSKPDKSASSIHEDLLLIDFTSATPPASSSIDQTFDELFIRPSSNPPPPPSSTTTNRIDSRQASTMPDPQINPSEFVAKVVHGVTEQLKNDFPRSESSKKDFTPPLVRRFTIPYPPSQSTRTYENIYR